MVAFVMEKQGLKQLIFTYLLEDKINDSKRT